ncbi:MAG: hypothetical protein C0507_02505 [Cyanobacteria bacterium PR.3.49]|jgi:PAS domain S-box-containing protein|nr:hypothetical protein [Cyanobacteria bacterium PR.3.49]
MKTRSKLRLQILALVILPLIVEIGLLVWLSNLLKQADSELEKSIRAQKIESNINSISKRLYDAFFMYSAEKDEQLISKESLAPMIAGFRKTYDELENLTAGNERAYTIIKNSDRAATRCVELMEILRAALERDGRTTLGRAYRRPYWFELRKQTKLVLTPEFLSLRRDQAQVAEAAPLIQRDLRRQIQYLIWGGVLILAGLVSAVAFYLTHNIADKISKLRDNTLRLASNMPLNPVMQGNDDLSQLDQVFHRMAQELQAAARKERALLDNVRDLICSIDRTGKFVEVNQASFLLLGYKPDELLGSHLIDFLGGNDVSEVLAYFDKIQSASEKGTASAPLETVLVHKNGTVIDVTCSAQFAAEENLSFCVFHDITERRQAERMKQEVVAMVTHDLRTPLGTVNNVFDFLNQGQLGELTDKGKKFVGSGLRNTERMMSLINDLLDIEKIKSGNYEIACDDVPVSALFKGCIDLHSTLAAAQGIELSAADCQAHVWGDQDKLLRLLSNLVANALKFTPHGGKVSLLASESNGSVQISVQDTGPGIPKDKLASIFERFHQIEGEHKAGGSGLGLAICKLIAEVHDGRIWVESEPGKGSEFIVSLPASNPG